MSDIWKRIFRQTVDCSSEGRLGRSDQVGVLDSSQPQPVFQVTRPLYQVRGAFLHGAYAGREAAIGTVLRDDVLRGGRRWLRGCYLGQDVRLDVRSAKRSWKTAGKQS